MKSVGPLCSGVRRVHDARICRGDQGIGGKAGEGGETGVDLHTRHEPLQQRDGTDWKPFIHSLALSFSPVFDRESIDHSRLTPPSFSNRGV